MSRKLFFAFSILVFSAICAFSQTEQELSPVKWKIEAVESKNKLNKADKISVNLTAEIEKGWYLYSLEEIEGGPIPTKILLVENPFFKMETIVAPQPKSKFDTAFGMETKFYLDSVKFIIPLILQKDLTENITLKLKVRYQCCNDEMCLAPRITVLDLPIESKK